MRINIGKKIVIIALAAILASGTSWAISAALTKSDKKPEPTIFPSISIKKENLPDQASNLLRAGFGKFYANKNWSIQLDREAAGYFLVKDGKVSEVHHPIDSPFRFWEITSPKYLEEQGFNAISPCSFSFRLNVTAYLVLASDGGLYNFEPGQLCDNGNLGEYLDELDEALNELGFKSTAF